MDELCGLAPGQTMCVVISDWEASGVPDPKRSKYHCIAPKQLYESTSFLEAGKPEEPLLKLVRSWFTKSTVYQRVTTILKLDGAWTTSRNKIPRQTGTGMCFKQNS